MVAPPKWLLLAGLLSLAAGAHGFLVTTTITSATRSGIRSAGCVAGVLIRSNPVAYKSGGSAPRMAASSPQQRSDAKRELLDAIKPLEKGITASEEDVARVETLAQNLEKLNPNPASLASPLINGRWELVYTTSGSILGKGKPRRLRPKGPIYQDIDAAGLRAKNHQVIRPLPFIKIPNSVRAALTPTSASAVDVQFIRFRIGPIKIKAPKSAKGALDTTYVDEEVRVSRGDKGNLFVLTRAEGLEPEFS